MRKVLSILLDDEQVQYLLVMKQLMANPSAQKWGGGKWIDNRHESIYYYTVVAHAAMKHRLALAIHGQKQLHLLPSTPLCYA